MAISYKEAGVDKEEGYRAVELMKKAVAKTMNSNVSVSYTHLTLPTIA